MIYVDTTPDEWTEKFGCEVTSHICCECKKEIVCDVPIAIKGYRGFEMRKHGCKEHRLAAVFVPIGKEKEFWSGLFTDKELENV